jgi:hypothetical protein
MHPKNKLYIDRLQRLGLLEQFKRNCDNWGTMPYDERVNIPATTFYRFVTGAFGGVYTSEGQEFWDDVANGWYRPK